MTSTNRQFASRSGLFKSDRSSCNAVTKFQWYASFILFSICFPTQAYSQTSSGTLGHTLANFISNVWQPFFLLVVTLSAVTGLFLFIRGLFRVIEISHQSFGLEGLNTAIVTLVTGALLLTLPDIAGFGMLTVLGEIQGGDTLGGGSLDYHDQLGYQGNFLNQVFGSMANVEPVQSCIKLDGNISNNSSNIVGCMVGNLARNVIPIAIFILFVFAFIIGFAGLASNIIGLIKTTQRQTRISSILASMLFNVTLMNIPFLFRIIANTLISPSASVLTSNGINSSSSLLVWTATETNFQDWCDLFTHFTIILLFFGALAFVRGVYMIKIVSEVGRQGGSYGMASVYMIAGILLANLKTIMLILSGTVGISGVLFCS